MNRTVLTERIAPAMGIRLTGLNLKQTNGDMVGQLRQLLNEHLVVAVTEQDLEEEQLHEFGRLWGDTLSHPSSVERKNPHVQILASKNGAKGRGLGAWHSDMSWHPTPPWVTMLHARTIPTFGGDTGYANQRLALELLDLASSDKRRSHRRRLLRRDQIERLQANHTGKGFGESVPDSIHPVVRTHNETNAQALYVNPEFTTHIVDVDDAESDRILWPLWLHSISEEFLYRHRWKVGDLVIWDNRSVMHTAILDYNEPRWMTRVVIKGDKPH